MEGDDHRQNPHAIIIPYPLQGHINPFVNLTIKLASKGFTVTFINTESIHHQITKSKLPNSFKSKSNSNNNNNIFNEAIKSGLDTGADPGFEMRIRPWLDIQYATVSDGFPVSFDRSLNHDQFMEGILHVISAHIDEVVGNLILKDPSISCLVADTFFVWTSMIAKKYNLVNVSFWTEPALVLTQYYHLDLLKANGHFDCQNKREDAIDYLPGVDAIEPKDLTSYVQATDTSTVVHRIIHRAVFNDVKNVDFIICNTVQELEPQTTRALQQNQPFIPIGPIFPTGFARSVVGTSLWAESECTRWLDSRPSNSVLYISFGSYAHCEKDDIMEIAQGILQSNVSFIWVLRPDIVSSDDTDFLPVGFEEEIKGRGLIVPWCCQIEVISHPTVGGFLTHCGWNSILESAWCGLPLLCFPLLTDQFTNRKLVVDDWGTGLNLCDEKMVTRDEVAEKINRLMSRKPVDELRENVKKFKEKLESALSAVGSSENNLNQFICDVKSMIQEKQLIRSQL